MRERLPAPLLAREEAVMDEAWFIALGYVVFLLYTCGIMYLGILLEKKTNIDKTVCRKLTHVVSAFVWVICYHFFGCSIHWVLLNFLGAIALGFITLNKRFSAFGRDDGEKSPGMFYFALSTAVVALICYLVGSELYLYTGIAYYCLALGDGLAPLTSRLFGKHNLQIRPHKTLVGSATVFIVSFLSTLLFSELFGMGLSLVFIASVAALTTVTEFYGFRGTDNIFIELFVFGYLLLYHYGLVSLALEVVLILSPILAFLAVGSGAMATDAGIAAFFLFALVGFFGKGFTPIFFIGLLFLISTVVSYVGKRIVKKRGEDTDSHKARRAKQIIAVGLFAIIALILHSVTEKAIFYHIFFLALVEQIADSMASDIGRLTKRKNINIITWRPIEKGISGGVSALGTVAALISSFILTAVPYFLGALSLKVFVFIGILAFVGTVIDSVVGALFQSLYLCDGCSRKVESPMHCGKPARLIKGLGIIDNVAVNYIAGFVTCAMGALLIFI